MRNQYSTYAPEQHLERFWSKVNKNGPIPSYRPDLGPCWIWLSAQREGYGRFGINGKVVQAHRHAYELIIGPIPAGLDLDHLCRVPICVNPAHMEPVTRQINLLRGIGIPAILAARDRCKNGHVYNETNLRIYKGIRFCRTCRNTYARTWYGRSRAKPPRDTSVCRHGHAMIESNTFRRRDGGLGCLTCSRKSAREAARKKYGWTPRIRD